MKRPRAKAPWKAANEKMATRGMTETQRDRVLLSAEEKFARKRIAYATRLDPQLHARFLELAERLGRPQSLLVDEAITLLLDKHLHS